MVSSHLATLVELETVYGTEDLFDFLEIIMVDNFNRMQASEP